MLQQTGYVTQIRLTSKVWTLVKKPLEGQKENRLINIGALGCEDVNWIEMAQDWVQWWILVLVVLNFQVMVPES